MAITADSESSWSVAQRLGPLLARQRRLDARAMGPCLAAGARPSGRQRLFAFTVISLAVGGVDSLSFRIAATIARSMPTAPTRPLPPVDDRLDLFSSSARAEACRARDRDCCSNTRIYSVSVRGDEGNADHISEHRVSTAEVEEALLERRR